ncbi:hypothetical protein GCM10017653_33680 [Ancylobacter defluvii]|uniref:Uncharacterized protein n=1 Tax=Ancylobacter defluvii TaxID=1282440 RepID=A0A9W6K1M3_9HYPH|nr:hypothetical protein GCM10017653_33680 [Ancylobacter defluvii]
MWAAAETVLPAAMPAPTLGRTDEGAGTPIHARTREPSIRWPGDKAGTGRTIDLQAVDLPARSPRPAGLV